MNQKPGYDALLDEVCVRYGWCGGIVDDQPLHVSDFIPKTGAVTADQFVEWLFLADGIDLAEVPTKWHRQKQYLREAFIQHMGSDVVDASRLQYEAD